MTTTLLILTPILYSLSVFCEWAESKSRKWYSDRIYLRLSGFFFSLGTVALACAIAL